MFCISTTAERKASNFLIGHNGPLPYTLATKIGISRGFSDGDVTITEIHSTLGSGMVCSQLYSNQDWRPAREEQRWSGIQANSWQLMKCVLDHYHAGKESSLMGGGDWQGSPGVHPEESWCFLTHQSPFNANKIPQSSWCKHIPIP